MSEYNFTNDPSPTMTTAFDAAGSVILEDGATQGNHLTETFAGTTVTVSIRPPTKDWQIALNWQGGASGVFPVPSPGGEDIYDFDFQATEPTTGQSTTGTGKFKIKRTHTSGG